MSRKKFTDTTCQTKPDPNGVLKLTDADGLYLEIKPNGSRHWYVTYRLFGKRPRVALGAYPDISLSEAREERDKIRKLVKAGKDPAQHRQVEKVQAKNVAETNRPFHEIATAWLDQRFPEATAAIETLRQNERINRYLTEGGFTEESRKVGIGRLPIQAITRKHVIDILDAANAHSPTTRVRMQINARKIFDYAVNREMIAVNPLAGVNFIDTFGKMPKTTHRTAQHKPDGFGIVLRKIANYTDATSPRRFHALDCQVDKRLIRAYLNLLALTFVRPSELRLAEWAEFDLDKAVWSVPFSRLKQRTERAASGKPEADHRVPLAPQAIAILRGLKKLTGGGRILFPSVRKLHRPISDKTILWNMRLAGIDPTTEHTAHGFRASAKTMLRGAKGRDGFLFRDEAIEFALNHVKKDAYYRDDFFDERKPMMAWWANQIDEMRAGAKVVPMPTKLQKLELAARRVKPKVRKAA